jgi:hypothetical protein
MKPQPDGPGGGRGEDEFHGEDFTTILPPTSNGNSAISALLPQLQRRQQAAGRIVGGDPLTAAERALGRSREHPRTASRTPQVAGVRDAADHLLALGLPPLFDVETLRELWWRDRELAEHLARLAGVT